MAQQPPALTGARRPVQETSQTSSMQPDVGHGLSPLLQLPSELLQQIWRLLHASPDLDDITAPATTAAQPHQHALYSTCKAARDITTKFITGMCVHMLVRCRSPGAVLDAGLLVMARFPSLANLRSLVIKLELPKTGGCDLSSLLPHFLSKAARRLHTVERLTFRVSKDAVYTCEDTDSIAAACPNLQEITFIGFSAVLNPLAQLARLRELTLERVALPQDVMTMQSLSSLSQIDVLSIGTARGVGLDCVLPHLHGLSSLRSLQLRTYFARGSLNKCMQLVSSLQHLKQLTELQWLSYLSASSPVSGPDVHELGQLTQLVSLSLPCFTLDTAALKTLLALPKLVKLEAHSVVATPLQQQSNDEDLLSSCLKKWVLTECLSVKHPLRELITDSIEWVEGFGYAGHKPEDVRAASDLIAQIWPPRDYDEYRIVTLKSGSTNAQLNVELVAALQPLFNIEDIRLNLDGWRLDAAEVHAMLDSRFMPPDLEICRCNITDLGFAALCSAAALRWLVVLEDNVLPDAKLIAGLLLGRCFAGLPLDFIWFEAPAEVQHCKAQLKAYAESLGRRVVIDVDV